MKNLNYYWWILLTLAFSSCSVVREDIVFSEQFTESSCKNSRICDLSTNIITLARERNVSAGVARNSVGTLRPECRQMGENFLCKTSELVIPKTVFQPTQTTRTLGKIYDGYDSNREIIDLGGCKTLITSQNQNQSYLTIESYFDFTSIIKNETSLIHATGALLEDFTEATFVCTNECNFDIKSNSSTNSIKIILSKSRTSGRLSHTESNKRMTEIANLQDECSSL